MTLKDYVSALPADRREKFAVQCGTTFGHMKNVMYGYKPCSPSLAVAIERVTKGAVTRKQLRNDWRGLWPELASAGSREAAQ